jgi:hypothetical protein
MWPSLVNAGRWVDKIEIQDNNTKETESLPFGVGLP